MPAHPPAAGYGSITNSGLPVDAAFGTAVVSMATPEADAGMASAEVLSVQVPQDVPPRMLARGHTTHWGRPGDHCT